ncbi:hypothetical protein EOE18_14555 [Novosphingobium umbonatum]|uniref:Uncharacterized protein n=1 Tax=Novosphingobium umbonatum TaxID=1908524 RepID=A0A437N1S5_9SPHN|nr:hypothetical protein [Novosphingobium umbonatum]RVU03791.1 hypothetical protein EOE18_14555 [Novosphingobium umbonatum]
MSPPEPLPTDPSESGLRLQIARGDAVVDAVEPVLRHLLSYRHQALFSDDVMARLRAMLADLGRQLAEALDHAGAPVVQGAQLLTSILPEVPGLIAHLHAVALEWQVTERLAARTGLDPVLTPLIQALIGSSDGEVSARAMRLLAAQARFAQMQRRMQLPLAELPPELLHGVLVALHVLTEGDRALQAGAMRAEADLRAAYDEAGTRQGLLQQAVAGMGQGAVAGLALGHAGVAVFITALAQACADKRRDPAVLLLQEGQQTRLALTLRAAGARVESVHETLMALHGHMEGAARVPSALDRITVEGAAHVLTQADRAGGGA